jgi:class 3 adenylate cyclase
MIRIGTLRTQHADGLPFAREKLHTTLTLAGIRPVSASQVTACLSEAISTNLPAELTIDLAPECDRLFLAPASLAGRYVQLKLPHPVGESDLQAMQQSLGRLTHDELMHDLEYQVQERTAELRIERERSEKLLKNMLPAVVAERMKLGETIADQHIGTVLFADITGFTAMSMDREPEDIVAILDAIFSRFDEFASKHALEKIKTIGDCYMAVSGLPLPQFDHVDRAVNMGLDIVESMSGLRETLNIDNDIRIGVHTGRLVAGVIGTTKYAYDVWGDTVNVASRMESHGLPGHVQVSDDVKQQLGNRFLLEERGTIEIKNHVAMKTWFVKGLAAL